MSGIRGIDASGRSTDSGTHSVKPVALSEQQPQRETTPVTGVKGTSGPVTPAPVDAPSTESHASPSKPRTYSILVGSFRYEPEAATLIEQLSGLGYQAHGARVTSAMRGTWHQVFVGPYGDLEGARLAETRVRQLPGYADAHVIPQ